jgi:predicted AlkP superfamily phosphohydrolase/phosphomutase
MTTPTKVLGIALDAAEPRLIEAWTADGTLPNLRQLLDGGAYGRLESTARELAGSVWPTFYTGTPPSDHGIFHHLQWRAEAMAHRRPAPDWLPAQPFWRSFGSAGPRVVALDIPMVYSPEPFDGVEISGWASHDRLAPPASHPPELMAWVEREFGAPHLKREGGSHRKPESFVRLRDELNRATRELADLAVALLQREPWDLFLCGFGAAHRGGHLLWGLPESRPEIPPALHSRVRDSLRDVYVECDAAVGRLVAAAGDDASVLVFSLHGMGPNTSRAEAVLPKLLARVLSGKRSTESVRAQGSGLDGLRQRIPVEWRSGIRRRLPLAWQDWLTAFWRTGRIDWSTTRALCQLADAQGYLRINLRGREAAGIVAPGAELDALCAEVAAGLAGFCDADTGEPIVAEVVRVDRSFPDGAGRARLPDLLVLWADTAAAGHLRIASRDFGEIPWPTPGGTPDGRTANHREHGFLVAAGDGIPPRSRIAAGHILDLAPTFHALLGLPQPAEMGGRPLLGRGSGGSLRTGSS